MADDIQTATPDPVPTPAQLAAAAVDTTTAPVADATPAPVATPDQTATQPDIVAAHQTLLGKIKDELETHKALLAVVTDIKNDIDKVHADLTSAGNKILAEEKSLVSWTETHKTRAALIIIAAAVLAWLVVTKL